MSALRLLFAEIKRSFIMAIRYPIQDISRMATLYVTFMGVYYFSHGTSLQLASPEKASAIVVAFLMWVYSLVAIGDLSNDISEECQTGTLEQLYTSPLNIPLLWIARAFGNFSIHTGRVMIFFALIIISTGINLKVNIIQLLPVFILTMIGLYGFGFILGGLTLIYKKTVPVINVLHFVFLFFSGAVAPLDHFPYALRLMAETLPLTQGIKVSNAMIASKGLALDYLVSSQTYVLTLNALFYLIMGIGTYQLMECIARKRGLLGQF